MATLIGEASYDHLLQTYLLYTTDGTPCTQSVNAANMIVNLIRAALSVPTDRSPDL